MTVSYSVPDTETGFLAEVHYDGEAQYPLETTYSSPHGYNFKREAKIDTGHSNKIQPIKQTHHKAHEDEVDIEQPFQHFKPIQTEEEEEMVYLKQLGLLATSYPVVHETSQEQPEVSVEQDRYPHFQSYSTVHTISPHSSPEEEQTHLPTPNPLPDPILLYGEFPQLNPRPLQFNSRSSKHPTQPQLNQNPSLLIHRPSEHPPSRSPEPEYLEYPPRDEHKLRFPSPLLPVTLSPGNYQTQFHQEPIFQSFEIQQEQPTRIIEQDEQETEVQPFVFFPAPQTPTTRHFQPNDNHG